MPEHPIPRPVDLTDLPNPTRPDLPMPPDQPISTATRLRGVAALHLAMRGEYDRAAAVLARLDVVELDQVVESAVILADLATTAMLAGVPAGPGPVLGSVGEYASQITVAEPLPPTRPRFDANPTVDSRLGQEGYRRYAARLDVSCPDWWKDHPPGMAPELAAEAAVRASRDQERDPDPNLTRLVFERVNAGRPQGGMPLVGKKAVRGVLSALRAMPANDWMAAREDPAVAGEVASRARYGSGPAGAQMVRLVADAVVEVLTGRGELDGGPAPVGLALTDTAVGVQDGS